MEVSYGNLGPDGISITTKNEREVESEVEKQDQFLDIDDIVFCDLALFFIKLGSRNAGCSDKSSRLPPMWPGFDSSPVPHVG